MEENLLERKDVLSMEITEALDFLAQLGLGACLLDRDLTLLQLNPPGALYLHCGPEDLGRPLPDCARPLLSPSLSLYAVPAFGEYLLPCPVPKLSSLPPGQHLLVFRRADKDALSDMLLAVLDQIREGVVLCDAQGRIIRLNASAVRLDTLSNQNVIGQDVNQVYVKRDEQEFLIPQVLRSGDPIRSRRQHYATCYGKEVDTLSNCFPILRKGQTLGAFNIVEDWSAMDQIQKKVIDLR